jgi:hypothetical protein
VTGQVWGKVLREDGIWINLGEVLGTRGGSVSNPSAEDEVVDLCSELIRIDTSNPGDHSGPGERAAA